ncbi:MAG: hypothetical protein LBM28_07215 [Oscillospiraceae bacterium]|jgi:hypothetical protein|nr:hypothetical protein [Oscillospiraceae bacterium]
MKKQGNLYLKIITIVLAVTVLGYVLLSAVSDRGGSYALETVLPFEVGDGQTVSGFVVRSEKILVSDQPTVVHELSEGERVGAGQRVATGYSTDSARAVREELSSARDELAQLQNAAEDFHTNYDATLDADIADLIIRTAAYCAQDRLASARTSAAELQPLVLRRSLSAEDAEQVSQRIFLLEERISELESRAQSGAVPVIATSAGYYSQSADGFENILTPDAIMSMSPGRLRELAGYEPTVVSNAVGRLILGQRWYYITEVPASRIASVEVGDSLTVSFAGQNLQNLRTAVERIGEETNGMCILVLSCGSFLQEVSGLREQSADIIFETYAGLRVSKQALYVLDGQSGVYILEGSRADWKAVEILYEYGDGYVVKLDQSSTNNLWPEDEVILTSDEIFDGKVMQ